MSAENYLPDVLETVEAERLATGFVFTEGPLWHPDGFYYFVDIRTNRLYRITPGQKAEVVRETAGGNGTTFDLQGRLILCEGGGHQFHARRYFPAPGEERQQQHQPDHRPWYQRDQEMSDTFPDALKQQDAHQSVDHRPSLARHPILTRGRGVMSDE